MSRINTILLSITILLTFMGMVSGFISRGKLGDDSELDGAKKMLLTADLMLMVALVMLGVIMFLLRKGHRTIVYVMLGITVIILLVSGILYMSAAQKIAGIDKDTYKTAYNSAMVAGMMSFVGLTVVCIIAVSFFMGRKKVHTISAPPVTTKVNLQESYTEKDGAMRQLQQLQVGTGV